MKKTGVHIPVSISIHPTECSFPYCRKTLNSEAWCLVILKFGAEPVAWHNRHLLKMEFDSTVEGVEPSPIGEPEPEVEEPKNTPVREPKSPHVGMRYIKCVNCNHLRSFHTSSGCKFGKKPCPCTSYVPPEGLSTPDPPSTVVEEERAKID